MPDPVFDHGPLKDDWDRYAELFGPLPFHVHKLESKTLRALADLISAAVARGSPITKSELDGIGYEHPHPGLFH
jgi:hypothetical protein